MTYLLTEIALGLLGHKFFDVDGVRQKPCLNENSFANIEDSNDDSMEKELLQIENITVNKHDAKSVKTEKQPENVTCSLQDDIEKNKDEEKDNEYSANTSSESSTNSKASVDKGLIKLLIYERSKLREHVKRNKTDFMHTFNFVSSKEDAAAKASRFKMKQRVILSHEKAFLSQKRREIEKDFCKINFDKYQKYISTFQGPLWEDIVEDNNS